MVLPATFIPKCLICLLCRVTMRPIAGFPITIIPSHRVITMACIGLITELDGYLILSVSNPSNAYFFK